MSSHLNYYIDLKPFVDSVLDGVYGPLDSNGLPFVNCGGHIGVKRNPTTIAKFAIGNYQQYIKNPQQNKEKLNLFKLSLNWLSKKCFNKGEKKYWLIYFNWPIARLKSPWYSGMTQGLCISVFVRAFLEFGDSFYLSLAKGGFEVLNDEIKDGGALFCESSNFWIEEYPSNSPSHVLNGFIYAIFGLFDLYFVTNNYEVQELLRNSINTLKNNLQLYDLNFWSAYDLSNRFPSSLHYHKRHIEQLKSLYYLTNKNIFLNFSYKWKNYMNKWKNLIKSQKIFFYNGSKVFLKTYGLKEGIELGINAFLQNLQKKM